VKVPETRFTSPLHDERTAAILGIALGVAFATCFVTGLLSHDAQDPHPWFAWPARPAGLYRFTQGLHIATGLASIPLLLAKLWTVYPKLLQRPVVRDVAHAIERVSIVPLVAGALFMLFTGFANINLWYPWSFNFRTSHYWVAWITIGALVVHLGAKWTTTRRALSRSEQPAWSSDALGRRGFLLAVGGVTLFTVGQTVWPLRRIALLAPRRPDAGPQGFPVNRTRRPLAWRSPRWTPRTGSGSREPWPRRWPSHSQNFGTCHNTKRPCPSRARKAGARRAPGRACACVICSIVPARVGAARCASNRSSTVPPTAPPC
jgi:hypothetical protein